MNRFRLGLHIPGNVIVACKRCNVEKRRDDQLIHPAMAESGWESFLSHDSMNCKAGCKACAHWTRVWPNSAERVESMRSARQRIAEFRARYPESLEWSVKATSSLRQTVDTLYRGCQEFATVEIRKTVEDAFVSLSKEVGQRRSQQMARRVTAVGNEST